MRYLIAHVLAPLIRRNYRLRAQHKLPDQWYWADLQCMRMGYAMDDQGHLRALRKATALA